MKESEIYKHIIDIKEKISELDTKVSSLSDISTEIKQIGLQITELKFRLNKVDNLEKRVDKIEKKIHRIDDLYDFVSKQKLSNKMIVALLISIVLYMFKSSIVGDIEHIVKIIISLIGSM